MTNSNSALMDPAHAAERRGDDRSTMVLRVGLLNIAGRSAFCILRNISSKGVQVKAFAPVLEGADVYLQVGDEKHFEGRVAWVRDGLAGIAFISPLDPTALLRVRQMATPQRRRASPRARVSKFAILRTGGQEYCSKLCDISALGAKIQSNRPIKPGRAAVLLLANLPSLNAYVRWIDGRDAGLVFETPIPIQIMSRWLFEQPHVTIS